MESIAVLGAGSWGTTLASHLAGKSFPVSLWEFDPRQAEILSHERRLKVLPQLAIPKNIEISSDITKVLHNKPLVVCATPSHFVRSTMVKAKASSALQPKALLVSVTKGLEEGSHKRMSEVIAEELPDFKDKLVVLSGPSHAEEVAQKIPTAVVAAADEKFLAQKIQDLFTTQEFRVYTQQDVIGVELGGSLKNVIAIACGVSDGLGLGDNTKASLITRGLAEMARLGTGLGAQASTFYGLTGLGDLIVTCASRHSRNRLLGEKLGQGKSLKKALAEMTMVAEGVKTATSAHALAQKAGVEIPIMAEIYRILYEQKHAQDALRSLLERPLASEM